jgi:hypothetical protein
MKKSGRGSDTTGRESEVGERSRKMAKQKAANSGEATAAAVVIEPLAPTEEQPEVDSWIARTERAETRRKRRARSNNYLMGGRYRRHRLSND